jgi:hypothetical protein
LGVGTMSHILKCFSSISASDILQNFFAASEFLKLAL